MPKSTMDGLSAEDSIIATEERLSEEAVYSKFTDNKLEMANRFINSIKTLRPVVEEINAQKESFKLRLAGSESVEDVDILEMQIEERDKVISSIYEQLVIFPDDEEVAGALVEFLEKNPHLRALMAAFKFHESLFDDILGARAKLDTNNSLNI